MATDKVLEAVVKTRLKKNLAELGAHSHWPVQVGMGAATVDCLACIPCIVKQADVGKRVGLFAAIECKRPGIAKPTERQRWVLEEVQAASGLAALVNSPDMTPGLLMTLLRYAQEEF